MAKKPVVGVFGHYGNRNLGDEAIVTATIQQLRRRLDGVEIVCFSLRPNDTAFRHGVEAFSVRCLPQQPVPVKPTDRLPVEDLPWNKSPHAGSMSGERDLERRGLKQRVKTLPIIGRLATAAAGIVSTGAAAAREIGFIVRSAGYLKRFDLIVVAGSNQFLDNFDGTWGFPYALLKWSLLGKLTGTRIAFVSVGAGPLQGRLSKIFVRLAIRLSDYASYRDQASKRLVESGYPRVNGQVYPDLAFGLAYSERERPSPIDRGKPVVGINPMPVYDRRYWFEHDDRRYRAYVGKLAILAARLIERNYPVFLFPTMWRDDDVIRDVLDQLRSAHGIVADTDRHVRPSQDVPELVDALQSADIIVATRFHAVVLPYHLGVPVLGIGYFRKTSDLMEQMDQSRYHEDLDELDVERLWTKFLALESNWLAEQEKITRKAAEYHRQLDEQWDRVVRLIRD
jgi:polysaccharide pyruvyl transferase WcaK-like protein